MSGSRHDSFLKIIGVLLVVVAGITPIILFYGFFTPFMLPKRTVSELVISLLIIVLAIGWLTGRMRLRADAGHYLLCMFVVVGILSFAGVPDRYDSLRRLLLYVDCIVVAIAAYQVFADGSHVRAVVGWIALFSVVPGVAGLYEIFTQSSLFMDISQWGGRTSSTFGAPPLFAGFVLLILFVAQYGIIVEGIKTKKLLYGILWLLMAVNLVRTGTASAWGAFVVSETIFVILLLLRPGLLKGRIDKKKFIIAILFCAVIISIATVTAGKQRYGRIFSKSFLDNKVESMEMRYRRWDAAWNIFYEHPAIGAGPAMFPVYYPVHVAYDGGKYDESGIMFPENLPLLVLSETGATGGLFLLAVFVYTLIKIVKTVLRQEDEKAVTALAMGSAAVAVLLYSMFHYPLHTDGVWPLFWLCVAGVWGAAAEPAKDESSISEKLRKVTTSNYSLSGIIKFVAMLAVAVCIAGFSITFMFKEYFVYTAYNDLENNRIEDAGLRADIAIRLTNGSDWVSHSVAGLIKFRMNDYPAAYDEFEKAAAYRPYSKDLYNHMFNTLDNKKYPEKAIALLDTIIGITPEAPRPYMQRAIQYEKMGRYADAAHDLDFYLKHRNSKEWREYYMLFLCLARQEEKDMARERDALWKAISLKPDTFLPYYQMGMIFVVDGKRKKAEEMLKRALELNPDFEEAKLQLEALQINQ